VYIYRLPNVFGKWCRPEYNSVVATFSHHIANGLAIDIHDENVELTLVYVDDVIASFKQALAGELPEQAFHEVRPSYQITLGELAAQFIRFRDSRKTLITEKTGSGLTRALYATYLSYLEPDAFSYSLTGHNDERGTFVEVLKTQDSGQFSVFTARPGITRGGHYHHTKTEKFLVVQGQALFKFRHMQTGQTHEITTSAENAQVVETIPGWAHDITNIGSEELIVLLWANEIFDPDQPDTIGAALDGE
jgi:UDP-2-acetamido-2,6-beta-L-arabino-hexul-4-ose reductase